MGLWQASGSHLLFIQMGYARHLAFFFDRYSQIIEQDKLVIVISALHLQVSLGAFDEVAFPFGTIN